MDPIIEEMRGRATRAVLNLLKKVRRDGFSRSLFDNILPLGVLAGKIYINNVLQYCRKLKFMTDLMNNH